MKNLGLLLFALILLAFISFSCMTTASLMPKSKYPQYTISQAKLLVDTGKCALVSGTLDEFNMREGRGGSRIYETPNFSELYNAIDTYVELDNANAFVLIQRFTTLPVPVFAFTTMSCSE